MRLSEGERKVLRALAGSEVPLTIWHIVKETGLSKSTVRSYLNIFLKVGMVRRSSRGLYTISATGLRELRKSGGRR